MDIELPNGTVIQDIPEGMSKADIMAKHSNLAVNAQEREAHSSQEYKDHLKAIEQAQFEHLKFQLHY